MFFCIQDYIVAHSIVSSLISPRHDRRMKMCEVNALTLILVEGEKEREERGERDGHIEGEDGNA